MEHTIVKPQTVEKRDTLWFHVVELLKNPWYCASQLLVALLSFGYFITNYTIGIDNLLGEYHVSGRMIQHGRMTWTLLGRLFRLYDHQPFFDAAFGVFLMLILVTLLCAFFRLVTKGRISVYSCIAFGGLFISYPLIVDSLQFPSLIFFITGGGIMALGALYALYCANTKTQLIRGYIVATVLLVMVASLYESILICYIFVVFAYLLLTLRYEHEPKTVKQLLLKGLHYAIPLIVAVVLEALLSNALIGWLGLEPSHFYDDSIMWMKKDFIACLKDIVYGFYDRIIVHSLIYLPLGILMGAMAVMFIYGVVDVVRHKPRFPLVLCYAGLFLCLVLFSLIQATPSGYRMLQVFSYFIAFTGLLLVQSTLETKCKTLCCIVAICMSFLVYHQAGDTNRWFVLSHRNYVQEQVTINRIGITLQTEYDTLQKPVAFVGNYKLADNITRTAYTSDPTTVALMNKLRSFIGEKPLERYEIADTAISNVFDWHIMAGDYDEVLFKYFDYFGYSFTPCTAEMYQEAQTHIAELPTWPSDGSIRDMGDYIIVNFGK